MQAPNTRPCGTNFLLTKACRVPLTVCACGRQAGAVRHLVTAPLTPIKMGTIIVSYRTFHLVWAVNYPRSSVRPPQLYKPQALPPACSQTPTRLELSVSLFERWLDWAKTSCFGLEFLLTSLPILVFPWIIFSACPRASCAQCLPLPGALAEGGQEWTCRLALLSFPLPKRGRQVKNTTKSSILTVSGTASWVLQAGLLVCLLVIVSINISLFLHVGFL